MKKLLSFILFALVGACVAGSSGAATYARGPKETKNFGYTTTITTVTANNFNSGTSTSTIPGAVYDVYLTTGAAGDYCVLYDTNVALGLTVPAAGTSNLTNQLGPRFYVGSTTATTVIQLDPPIIFYSGLYAACTTAADGAVVEFETGRGLSGN